MPILKPQRGTLIARGHPQVRALAADWIMNEGSGLLVSTAVRRSPALNGTGIAWAGGPHGPALAFGGSAALVTASNLALGSSICTVAGWLLVTGSSTTQIVCEWTSDWNLTDHAVQVLVDGTNHLLYAGVQASVSGYKFRQENCEFPANQWFHFAAIIYNDTTTGDVRLFINGVEKSTTVGINTKNLAGTIVTAPVYVGARGGTSLFLTGRMSGLSVYSRALTSGQIASLYREPYARFGRDPIELWTAAPSGGSPPAGLSIPVAMHHYESLRRAG